MAYWKPIWQMREQRCYSAPPNDPQTYTDDVRFEEQPTVEQIYFGDLDEKTIKDAGVKTIKITIKNVQLCPLALEPNVELKMKLFPYSIAWVVSLCACVGSCQNPPPKSAYHMPKYYDKTELMKRVTLLKKGMSVEQCIAIIGAPTNRRNEFAKEKNVLLGISLYFVVHQNGSRLDPSIDCYLQASFDRVGNLIALSEFNMK